MKTGHNLAIITPLKVVKHCVEPSKAALSQLHVQFH
jgi:hypothetical protein